MYMCIRIGARVCIYNICTSEIVVLLPRLPDGRLAFERQQDRPMATSQGDVSSLEASNPSIHVG